MALDSDARARVVLFLTEFSEAADEARKPQPDDWTTRAACRDLDPDMYFVQGAEKGRAVRVCVGCPVWIECLSDALDNQVKFGVWGGMTERERRRLLRRRPDVASWRDLLSAARNGAIGAGMLPEPYPSPVATLTLPNVDIHVVPCGAIDVTLFSAVLVDAILLLHATVHRIDDVIEVSSSPDEKDRELASMRLSRWLHD